MYCGKRVKQIEKGGAFWGDRVSSVTPSDPGKAMYSNCPPCVGDGTFYAGRDDRYLYAYALDVVAKPEGWAFKAVGEIDASPGVVEKAVYAICDDGYLRAVR